jgi:hypothetical protein
MEAGENLAEFRPAIDEAERVVEVEGSLLPDGAVLGAGGEADARPERREGSNQ